MAIVYTHDFRLKSNEQDVTGEIEFNEDGIVSFRTDDPLDGLTLGQNKAISDLFHVAREFFVAFGEIEKIKIDKKD